jgi:hypothetical protein
MTKYTARKEQGAKMTHDIDGKFAPQFGSHWLKAEAAKAERLAKRTFSTDKVAVAESFGVDADEIFAS